MNTSEYLQRAALVAAGPRQCGKSKILRPSTGSMEGLASRLPTQQTYNAMNASFAPQINHLNLSRASVRIGARCWLNVKTTNPTLTNPPHSTPNCLSLCQTCQNKSQARNELLRKNKFKLGCPSIEPILSCNEILLTADKETLALWCLTTAMNDLDAKRQLDSGKPLAVAVSINYHYPGQQLLFWA